MVKMESKRISEIGIYAALGLTFGAITFYAYQYITSPSGKALNPFTNSEVPPATLNDAGRLPGNKSLKAPVMPAQVFDEKTGYDEISVIEKANRKKNQARPTKWHI